MSTNLPSEEYANIPKSLSHLRACKRCYLIKEYEDVFSSADPNIITIILVP